MAPQSSGTAWVDSTRLLQWGEGRLFGGQLEEKTIPCEKSASFCKTSILPLPRQIELRCRHLRQEAASPRKTGVPLRYGVGSTTGVGPRALLGIGKSSQGRVVEGAAFRLRL